LPELITAGFVGYVTLETHSLHDLMNITATLEAVRQSAQDRPNGLQGIEFVLRRKKERISTPDGKGGRASREKWLVSIEPVPSWAQTYLAMASSTLAIEAPRVDMLTGEVLDDDEDDSDEEGSILDAVVINQFGNALHALNEVRNAASAHVVTTEQPKQTQATNGQADPPGFAVWADWSHVDHAIAWGLSQGVFKAEAHARNAYAKVKEECKPANSKAMWQCWYQDVMQRVEERAAIETAVVASYDDGDNPDDGDSLFS
jgi:hypothetical protein